MALVNDGGDRPPLGSQPPATGTSGASETIEAVARRKVLVVDTDPALFDLIEEWLAALGYSATLRQEGAAPERFALVILDIPFPRQGRLDLLREVASDHPGTPMLALSSTFFAGIDSNGAVARALGVAGVLPKPLRRDALIAALEKLFPPQGGPEAP